MEYLQSVVDEFLDETAEQMGFIIDDILILEKKEHPEGVNRIFRVFHTIKGNALMLGFDNLGHFTHAAEELLSCVRKGEMAIDRALINLILASVDKIKEIIDSIRTGHGDGADIESLSRKIEQKITPVHMAPRPCEPPAPLVLNMEEDHKDQPRILVVEDDFTSRQIIFHFLSRYGLCHVAKDGVEALEAVKLAYSPGETPYRLICMDILMPRLDGIEAAQQIREKERELGIEATDAEAKIVMISAVNDASMIVKACYECGANYYFVKPLDFAQMGRQLKKLGFLEPT